MKHVFSLILPVFAAGVLVACSDLSGIENRVDSLESRVAALETAVGKINDRVDALKTLVEGGTISSVVEKDGVYTITLSNGKTITLNQGSVGVANPPVVSIDAEGYWTVDYGKGAEYILVDGKKVKAVGADGVTPMFGVDANSYWTVSYDGGKTYEQVKDADGNPVKAVPDGGSSEDKWFEKVSVVDGNLEVVLKDGKSYTLPVVSDFSCVIKGAEGIVTFTYGDTKTFDVELTGVASVMVTAPQGWSASLENAVLSVTAPAALTKALSADSDTDVCLLAISEKGFSSISKLRVKVSADEPVVTYPGLYGKYRDGEDVVIGGVTVNKTTYPSVNYISAASEDKTLKAGVNFVDADAVAEFPKTTVGADSKLVYTQVTLPFIVVGNNEDKRTEINTANQIQFVTAEDETNNMIVFDNVVLSTGAISENYLLAYMTSNSSVARLGLKNCRLNMANGKNLTYFTNDKPVKAMAIEDCDVNVESPSAAINILNVQYNKNTEGNVLNAMDELTVTNNVFWSTTAAKELKICLHRGGNVANVQIVRNTFVNVYPQGGYSYCQLNDIASGMISNNVCYFADYGTYVGAKYSGFVREEDGAPDATLYGAFTPNYAIYDVTTDKVPSTNKLKVGSNSNAGTVYTKLKADASEMFDFTEDSENFNIAKGIFKPKKAEYGAQR